MTIEEIFSGISRHMVEGLMFHSQLSDYFYFLGLNGYGNFHYKRYLQASKSYKKVSKYYLSRYGKLVAEDGFTNPKVIPEAWHRYTREDVNMSTRKTSLASGFEKWIKWERDTKDLYKNMYAETQTSDPAAAAFILDLVRDVDAELADAEQQWLELKAMDYSMPDVIMMQGELK